MRIFVDDMRIVKGFDYIAKNAEDFFNYCKKERLSHIEVLSLDHDLGGSFDLTGYDIVKMLPEVGIKSIGTIQFHTANPVGFENMLAYSTNLKKHGIIEIEKIIAIQLDSRSFWKEGIGNGI